MGRLTTHVLDIAQGRPGAGMQVQLYTVGDERRLLTSITTNADGRCDRPLLEGKAFHPGAYELLFHTGAYFKNCGMALPDPPFFDAVPVRFAIAAPEQDYHVPLLVSPWSYTTYRGT